MWTSLIASILGLLLRRMMRSENETIERIGTIGMTICFIIGGISLVVYLVNK
jgi:hypothetical protein